MADADQVRSQFILKDIYGRYGIPADTPLPEAVEFINNYAVSSGVQPSAWANPEERAAARAEYANKGKTDREKQTRWDESVYLLDPHTYEYMQGPGRDMDFLTAMHDSASVKPEGPDDMMPQSRAVRDALAYWDKSNANPLFRDAWYTSNYQAQHNVNPTEGASPARIGGFLSGLLNVTQNPDVPSGNYLNFSETLPDRVRMGGSGEADTGQEAWEGAQAKRIALNRYRLQSPSPVLDLPAGATPEQREARIRELVGLTQKADVPAADQRWATWTKQNFGKSFVPPGFVTDTLDFATSMLDPSLAIPVGTTAAGAAKVAAKGAGVAGGGWVKPLLSNLAKKEATGYATDMGVEQAAGHGIGGSIGGKPGRDWGQFLVGDWNNPAEKSQQQVDESRQARTQLYDQLRDDDRVSTADSDAYSRLGLRVHVPYPYR